MPNNVTLDDNLKDVVSARAHAIFKRAHEKSTKRLKDCQEVIDSYLDEKGLPSEQVCPKSPPELARREDVKSSGINESVAPRARRSPQSRR